jgi:hypothetical protein
VFAPSTHTVADLLSAGTLAAMLAARAIVSNGIDGAAMTMIAQEQDHESLMVRALRRLAPPRGSVLVVFRRV